MKHHYICESEDRFNGGILQETLTIHVNAVVLDLEVLIKEHIHLTA